jgi:hypothetical protein
MLIYGNVKCISLFMMHMDFMELMMFFGKDLSYINVVLHTNTKMLGVSQMNINTIVESYSKESSLEVLEIM